MMRLEKGNVAVEWYNADEGWNGDYDPDDPEDENLLRFDFYGKKDDRWLAVLDASYCTRVPADTPESVLKQLLEILLEDGADPIEASLREGINFNDRPDEISPTGRHIYEQLSWIHPGWANDKEQNDK